MIDSVANAYRKDGDVCRVEVPAHRFCYKTNPGHILLLVQRNFPQSLPIFSVTDSYRKDGDVPRFDFFAHHFRHGEDGGVLQHSTDSTFLPFVSITNSYREDRDVQETSSYIQISGTFFRSLVSITENIETTDSPD